MKKLGFGCMRLPLTNPDDPTSVDLEQVKAMVDLFLERRFTYFDTAYFYHKGTSESVLKHALVNRHPRTSFTLADNQLSCARDMQRFAGVPCAGDARQEKEIIETLASLLFSLADVAVGLAVHALHQGKAVTVNANVNFIRSSQDGSSLLGVAQCVRCGRSIGFFQAEVYDNLGTLLLSGQYVMHLSQN